jgi:hypothetical protein
VADAPGSWLTKLKPFQAALVGALLVVLVILGLWGRGNYTLLGLLSVDNREADFQEFLESRIADQEPEIRRQYLTRLIVAALNVAEALDEEERTRFAASLEADLRQFDFYTLEDGRLRDRLALSFGHRVAPEDADEALRTRERIATAAVQGIGQLASHKDALPPLAGLANALVALDFVDVRSDTLIERLRQLDADDPQARELRGLLYAFDGPFRKADLFFDAPASFVEAIHALKTHAEYYRHDLVITLWQDALEGEGIFTIERSDVEVRIDTDPTLTRFDAVVCRGERDLYDAGFFLVREADGAFAHVRAKPFRDSRDCSRELLDPGALTIWLSPAGAAQLLVKEPRPLTAGVYPIRDVKLRRSPSHDLLPPMLAPTRNDATVIESLAAELVALR